MAKPEDDPGKGKPQSYVVTTTFTDDKGRSWQAGTAFQGDGEAVRKAIAAGKIKAKPEAEPKNDDPA